MKKMTRDEFEHEIERVLKKATETLTQKNTGYSEQGDGDPFHNFRVAAELQGITPKQAAAGMLAKHTVSVYDLCAKEDVSDKEVWDEKIQDHINYLLFIRAMAEEEINNYDGGHNKFTGYSV